MGILIKPQLPPELYVPTSLSWELSRHSCLGELSHGGMGTSVLGCDHSSLGSLQN